ncbi:MAG: hypothetical protein AAFX94_08635, partial [Myxococcota bacterium]
MASDLPSRGAQADTGQSIAELAVRRYGRVAVKSPSEDRIVSALLLILEDSGEILPGQSHLNRSVNLPTEEEFVRLFGILDEAGRLPSRMSEHSADYKQESGALISSRGQGTASPSLPPAAQKSINVTRALARERVPDRLHLQAAELLVGFREQAELVANAVANEGAATLIDPLLNMWNGKFGASGARYRPDDIYDALLRVAAAIYSVQRDLESGTLKPEDFKERSWDAVGPEQLYALATKRLSSGLDVPAARDEMLTSDKWAAVQLYPHNRPPFELRPENVSPVLDRSPKALFAGNRLAATFMTHPLGRLIRAGAIERSDAAAGGDPSLMGDIARLRTLAEVAEGRATPANASQVLVTVSQVLDVPLVDVRVAEANATEESLAAAKERGELVDYREVGGVFIVTVPRSIEAVARDAFARIDSGELDALGEDTKDRLRQMLGPDSSPGLHLQQSLTAESDARGWRELGGEAVELVPIALLAAESGGAAAAWAAKRSLIVRWGASVLGNSVTFSTLSGLRHGQLSPERYAADFLMFAVLSQAAPIAKALGESAGASVGGKTLAWLAGHGASVTAGAGIITGFAALEAQLRGRGLSLEETQRQLARNLILIGVVHASTSAVHALKPKLSAPLQAEAERFEAELSEAMPRILGQLHRIAMIAERARTVDPEKSVVELERAVDEMASELVEMDALSDKAINLLERATPELERLGPGDLARLLAIGRVKGQER